MVHLVQGFAVICLLCAVERPVLAQIEPQYTVVLMTAEPQERTQLVAHAVRSHLSDLPVGLEVELLDAETATDFRKQVEQASDLMGRDGTLAVIWEDGVDGRVVFQYFSGAAGERILVRAIDGVDPTVRSQEIALIVRATVLGALQNPTKLEAGSARLDAEPSALATWVPPRERRLGVAVAYALDSRARSHPAIHGLELDVRLRVFRFLHLSVGYFINAPMISQGQSASIRVWRHPVVVGLYLEPFNAPVRPVLGMSVIFDVSRSEVYGVAPDIWASPRSIALVVSGRPSISAQLTLADRLSANLSFIAEIPFNERRYVVQGAGLDEVVLDTWPIRPGLRAGLEIELF